MIKKSYSFMIITFLVMLFISINNVKAQGTSVSGSSATLVFGNGISTSCGSDWCDNQFSGAFTNSLSYMNLYFTNNIPKDKKVILSFSESVYPGGNFLVSGFNSTNLDISSVAVAVSSENGYLIYSYTIIGTMLNTQNYITLTHNVSQITTTSSWYKIHLPNLTYYDVSDSDSLLADILAQQQQWATQTNTYLGYITSNTDDIKTALANQSSSIVNAITSSSQQQHSDSQAINDSINNDSIDNNSANSSANTWNSKNASNGVITQLLTLPITLLNAIVSGIQTTCSSFNLGNLFGTDIILPCIDLSSLIGGVLFTTIDLLISGFMIYNISKKLIKIFNDFTNLKSNQIDEIYGGGSN